MARELAESLFDAFVGVSVDDSSLQDSLRNVKAKIQEAMNEASKTTVTAPVQPAVEAAKNTAEAAKQATNSATAGKPPVIEEVIFGPGGAAPNSSKLVDKASTTAQRVVDAASRVVSTIPGMGAVGGGGIGGIIRTATGGLFGGIGGAVAGGVGAAVYGTLKYLTFMNNEQAKAMGDMSRQANAAIEAGKSGDLTAIKDQFNAQRTALLDRLRGLQEDPFATPFAPGLYRAYRYVMSGGQDTVYNLNQMLAQSIRDENAAIGQVQQVGQRIARVQSRETTIGAFNSVAFDMRVAADSINQLRRIGPR